MRNPLLVTFFACSALALTGCDFDPTEWGPSDRYKEEFHEQHKLNSGGRVALETFNGSVEIISWDKELIEISGTKGAAREEIMRDIRIDVQSEADSVRIRAIRPVEHNCNCSARFVLRVPRKIVLDNIQTSNASIKVDGIDGRSRLRTSNASINVWSVTGDLEARTSNASIEIGRFHGAADLHTSNGRIRTDGVEGSLRAETSNSSIDARAASLDSGRAVVLSSSNGSISFELDKWSPVEVRATTTNSSINVRLPEDAKADLRASTSNGHITSDFAITTQNFGKTRVNGQMNGGGPLLELTTSNGNIRLGRK